MSEEDDGRGRAGAGPADGAIIRVQLNGTERELPPGLSVRGLLERLQLEPGLVVVERNREILERARYANVTVEDGDVLELVHFVGGG